jgi:hypothetical protein
MGFPLMNKMNWRAPLRRILHDKLEKRVRDVTGLMPKDDVRAEDVFIVGFPKSGSTWFQNLVAGAAFGVDPAHAPDTLIHALVPDVHDPRYYKRYATPTYFKSHELPAAHLRNVVYLLRDGRDAMVSYYHHLCAHHGGPVDFLEAVRSGRGLFPCKWHAHVEAWLANPYGARMITIRYEDLIERPLAELRRFCAFAGLERDEATLARIVAGATFDNMRKKEVTSGWDNADWPKDQFFVRRGKVGSYRDEMPADVLEAFMAEARGVMGRVGYGEPVDAGHSSRSRQ